MTEDVKKFLNYNADKALSNLGLNLCLLKHRKMLNHLFLIHYLQCQMKTMIFSGSGSSYVIGKAEATDDDDWDF